MDNDPQIAQLLREIRDQQRESLALQREHIAAFKAPRRVVFTDDMPRTPTGKLVKQRLRERYAPVRE